MSAINESPSENGVRSRRNVLALIGGAIAGAVAGTLGRPERALGGHDGTNVLHLGEFNNTPAGSSTGIGATAEIFALRVHNENVGPNAGGIAGTSKGEQPGVYGVGFDPSPAGVRGVSSSPTGPGVPDGSGTGVSGISGTGIGVEGGCPSGVGVFGHSQSGTGGNFQSQSGIAVMASSGTASGVRAHSDSSSGVHADTTSGIGVIGESLQGTGVRGISQGANGIGGQFSNVNGLGIDVIGRARFTTAGAGSVPQGQNSVFVSNPAVRTTSHISVTLVGNPGIRLLHWVERSPGSGFTVRLTPAPANQRPATAFTYLIVEAAA